MTSFKDTAGRVWLVKITLATLDRVEAATGVRLEDIATSNPLSCEQLDSAVTLFNVLCSIIEPEARQVGVTKEQFAESMDGDCTQEAREAVLEEQIFFSPQAWRPALRKTVKEAKKKLVRELEKAASDPESEKSALSLQEASVCTRWHLFTQTALSASKTEK